MTAELTVVEKGSVTTPLGFLAGATYAGLKAHGEDKLDLALLYSEKPAVAAGVFTTNRIKSPSVVLSQRNVAAGRARALIVNSGTANCCVGEQGLKDAQTVVALAGKKLGVSPEGVLICSTGVIGVELPIALIRTGLQKIALSREGGPAFAKAIMTTDTHPKQMALRLVLDGASVHIGGCAKGAGMIHPNMATMLCFITTDASVEPAFLQQALKVAVDASFNMITIDTDTSTNDSAIVLANGAAGGATIASGSPAAGQFQEALSFVCAHLAKEIVRDGEGATKLIEVVVDGARSQADARAAARTIASSNLVKSAVHGNDPNWGRIMAALGRSGARLEEKRVALYINGVCLFEDGVPVAFHKEAVIANLNKPEVQLLVRLGLGEASATAWGCDLSEAYVTINAAYTT